MTASTHNVRVTMPSVTSFQLTYWNRAAGSHLSVDGDQKIFLSDFSVTYDACA
ncbi:hypothetical protein ACQBAT_00590 [Ornithinimicrobium sp. Y1847]|uniref:hypothetical protein n=1 Tax=Ornithinimicrobium sp. Y1847 TaxID=3405419 RepID=UPI003B6806B8